MLASWRPDAGRRPCLEDAPVFYPTDEVKIFTLIKRSKFSALSEYSVLSSEAILQSV